MSEYPTKLCRHNTVPSIFRHGWNTVTHVRTGDTVFLNVIEEPDPRSLFMRRRNLTLGHPEEDTHRPMSRRIYQGLLITVTRLYVSEK